MTFFYTSDHHFNHAKIINYCNRPFYSVEQMNSEMIQRWNTVVTKEDTVYHLGDFAFHMKKAQMESILASLNGKKILIRGNHDHTDTVKLEGWTRVLNQYTNEEGVVLCHYPFECWDRSSRGSIHVHGHTHNTLKGNSQRCDIGVDSWDFYPCTLDQIKERLNTLPTRFKEF